MHLIGSTSVWSFKRRSVAVLVGTLDNGWQDRFAVLVELSITLSAQAQVRPSTYCTEYLLCVQALLRALIAEACDACVGSEPATQAWTRRL
jgi:hypothetical protein